MNGSDPGPVFGDWGLPPVVTVPEPGTEPPLVVTVEPLVFSVLIVVDGASVLDTVEPSVAIDELVSGAVTTVVELPGTEELVSGAVTTVVELPGTEELVSGAVTTVVELPGTEELVSGAVTTVVELPPVVVVVVDPSPHGPPRLTDVEPAALTPSVQCTFTFSSIVPVTFPGTNDAAFVEPPGGIDVKYQATPYVCAPMCALIELKLMLRPGAVSLFPIDQITACQPFTHLVCPDRIG